ncbi:hypothetical protein NMY22_g14771 [Coprinellus aureogranulatus]|nr:hypothetical protein NMY22_g14771 [Coprinellus aureogranulatus]
MAFPTSRDQWRRRNNRSSCAIPNPPAGMGEPAISDAAIISESRNRDAYARLPLKGMEKGARRSLSLEPLLEKLKPDEYADQDDESATTDHAVPSPDNPLEPSKAQLQKSSGTKVPQRRKPPQRSRLRSRRSSRQVGTERLQMKNSTLSYKYTACWAAATILGCGDIETSDGESVQTAKTSSGESHGAVKTFNSDSTITSAVADMEQDVNADWVAGVGALGGLTIVRRLWRRVDEARPSEHYSFAFVPPTQDRPQSSSSLVLVRTGSRIQPFLYVVWPGLSVDASLSPSSAVAFRFCFTPPTSQSTAFRSNSVLLTISLHSANYRVHMHYANMVLVF